MQEQRFIIGGEWRSGRTTLDVRDPYDNSLLTRVHQAEGADIDDAVASARQAFDVTSRYSSHERSIILKSAADQLEERKEELARTITAESGKPVTLARIEAERAVRTFRIASEETKRIRGENISLDGNPSAPGRRAMLDHMPIGVILCITPFNFPLNLVAHKIAPAIATGNSFILKPAPQTPLSSMLLGEILLRSGLVPSAVNILPMDNGSAERLITDDRIAMLSFTGSAAVGWMLKSRIPKKRTVLELGGNAAAIIDASADLTHAVARCVLGGFGYAGQVCIKVQRIMVHRSIAAEFTEQFLEAVKQIVTGDPKDERTLVGPMISEREAVRVETWVNEAVAGGARILIGGKRSGNFYEPTVLSDIERSMKVCSEELFGPVVTIQTVNDIQEAVALTNDSRYGLQAGIFSNDHRSIQYAYKHLHVGGVIVNDYPTFRTDDMPYGGVKDSGIGREGVRYAMEEMLEKKLLVL